MIDLEGIKARIETTRKERLPLTELFSIDDLAELVMEIERLKEDRREARDWAGKLWCRILVEKEQNAAAIAWAYKAARGATREACALLCEERARVYKSRADNIESIVCHLLADEIRTGDGVILSIHEKG